MEGEKKTLAGKFDTGWVLSARTVCESSVIFAYIQISFPHHVSAIRLGSPGNKYVSLIVLSRPIGEQRFLTVGRAGRGTGARKSLLQRATPHLDTLFQGKTKAREPFEFVATRFLANKLVITFIWNESDVKEAVIKTTAPSPPLFYLHISPSLPLFFHRHQLTIREERLKIEDRSRREICLPD